MKKKGSVFANKYHHQNYGSLTFDQLKKVLKEEFSSDDGIQGLTILELATLMKNLGCQHAINLDGGGSSTLWINGKVVNLTIGDKDEKEGVQTVRPVSDVIIFKKK